MEQRISTTTASRLLRVSKSTIQRQIKAGNLKAEMQKVSQGGGNCGMSNMIPVSEDIGYKKKKRLAKSGKDIPSNVKPFTIGCNGRYSIL